MSDRAWEILYQVYEALPRQGPGSRSCTERALRLCKDLPETPEVLDIGCGTGAQTLVLAEHLRGRITAVDSHAPSIFKLNESLRERGLAERVNAQVGDMATPSAPPQSVDLIWSEGALYNIGIPRALQLYAECLAPEGYLAFTEAVWHTKNPSQEVKTLFADYPAMGDVDRVLACVRNHGAFLTCDHFTLPQEAWTENFYDPMERRIASLRQYYANDADALAILDAQGREPTLRRQFADQYGYEFFVLRKCA